MMSQTPVAGTEIGYPDLADCTEESRAALLTRGQLHTFAPGDVLFTEGEPAGVMLLLLEGNVQLNKATARGRRQVLCDATPSRCGGVCMMFLNDPALATLRAASDGKALTVNVADFQELALNDPALMAATWAGATSCLRHMSSLVERLSFRKVSERIALALLDNTQENGELVRWTQAELAAEVGTTREVVARCLGGFQTCGAVRLGRGRVTVLSRQALMDEMK